MDWKLFAAVFGAIFIAEMADKTQLVNARTMAMIAGAGFIVIGIFTFYHGWQNTGRSHAPAKVLYPTTLEKK